MSRMPLLWFSFSFIAGILIAASVSLTAQIWLLLAGLAAVLRFTQPLIKKRLSKYIPAPQQTPDPTQTPLPRWPVSLPLAFCILCLGAARYQSSLPQVHPGFIAAYNDTETEMAITGTIVHPPDFRDRYTNLRVAVERAREENSISYTGVSGLLLARVPPHGDWHYGDRVVLHGMLQTPPESEEFSYREYLARQGVYTLMPFAEASLLEAGQGNPIYTAVFAFKQRALEMVYRLFPDPEASLLAGILLGVESGISTEVADAFSDTGTTHIIAISGFNMTIIAGLFVSLFGRWLGPRRGAILAAFGIAVYTFLVGADPAVVRAAIMGGFALLARQVGRRQQAINTLVFTAALMSFFNPHLPWDVGFQLSIAATLGLVLYAEPLKQWFVRLASRQIGLAAAERLAVPVGDYFLFTVAAQITTLPVILYHFQRLSLSSLPANLAILPAQPPIMVAGGLAVLFAMLYLPLGQLVAFFAWPFAVYTIRMVEWFARWRGGVLVLGETSLLVVTLFYAIMLASTFWGRQLQARLPAPRPAWAMVSLAVLAALTWRTASAAPDGLLHFTVLDVGMGEALFIRAPNGRHVLIGGGPSPTRLSDTLGRRLPFFDRQLDWLVVASPGEQQVAALPRTVERFPPGQVLWAGPPNASSAARYLQADLARAQIEIQQAQTGQVLDLSAGARLEVLRVNPRGMLLLLAWKNFRVVLPVGATFDDLQSLHSGRSLGPVTALLLAESGYAPLNPPQWIANLHPQLVLLSVAAGNYEGLPSAQTLAALQNYTLLRTDRHGWIELTTDGEQLWVSVER